MRPDHKTLVSLATLVRMRDGEAFLQMLDAELLAVQNQLIDAPDAQVPLLQGRARCIRELTTLLRDAPQIVEKHRTSQGR